MELPTKSALRESKVCDIQLPCVAWVSGCTTGFWMRSFSSG
jgi:hypothetical protein